MIVLHYGHQGGGGLDVDDQRHRGADNLLLASDFHQRALLPVQKQGRCCLLLVGGHHQRIVIVFVFACVCICVSLFVFV